MKTYKEMIMMYHTTIRNIGLYTSLSLAALAYSRSYRGSGFMRNIAGILISVTLIVIALSINYYLQQDLKHLTIKTPIPALEKWIGLLNVIGMVQITVLLINLFTFVKQFIGE